MADNIKMNTDSVAKFRNLVTEITKMIKDRNNDMFYLTENFNQVSASMFILNDRMYQAVEVGNEVINMLNKMAYDVEGARTAFINADSIAFKPLYRGDDSSSTSNNKDAGSKPSLIDEVLGSSITAGIGGAIDKAIGTASAEGALEGIFGARTYKVATGINRETRRTFGYAKDVEEVKALPKLAEGYGVVGTVVAAGSVYEDWKNNSSLGAKLGSLGIDAVTDVTTFGFSNSASTLGATAGTTIGTAVVDSAVGATLLDGAAVAIGVAAAPEVVVGAAAVVGAAVAVGALDWIASSGDNLVKSWLKVN
jgi:hypothetical protein